MLSIEEETFEGTFPFPPRYYAGNGFAMHFVDVGSGEPIVMLHGDPTWGYLYRHFIPPLARRYRCIVPDHMGMGKSDVPQDRSRYCLERHIANLEGLLLHLDVRDITLVLHDWGGPVGLGFATRHPERIKRLVLMNTWAFAPWPGGPFPRLLELIRSPRGEVFVLKKHGYLEPALLGTTHHTEHLTKTVLAAYHAPFPTPESRLAMLCWSRDIPVQETDVSYAEMKRIEQSLSQFSQVPILLVWGMRDPVLSPSVLQQWQHLYPQAKTHELEDASHFLQEDAPSRIVQWLEAFLRDTR
ncbi:alpha/beta fold hydrolase [Ktedonobacter racemifer]|uniref:Alpha/beta hydrolase fold protein n=1 Tax=Ktedonobacter racemifer DSM 44963 TaxID=485913 RepID=D6TCT2_KTERA|nr:alpha/beta fold hydrolase [Ktedonobacter racemifer]EFH88196.1 alpha/beta hydrolase fold protein [Ktedonobacter racemifer DSM 44963]